MEQKEDLSEDEVMQILTIDDGIDFVNKFLDLKKQLFYDKKEIEFASDSHLIFSFIYHVDVPKSEDYLVLELYDRTSKKSKYYHLKEIRLKQSILLNIANMVMQGGNKTRSIK